MYGLYRIFRRDFHRKNQRVYKYGKKVETFLIHACYLGFPAESLGVLFDIKM